MLIKQARNTCNTLELFEKYFSRRPHCFFLDSGMDHGKLGRFSFMGAEPFLILKSKGRLVEIIEKNNIQRFIADPFLVLKELLNKYSTDFYSDEIPFLGGAVGYFSYDLCHFLEKLPSTAIDDIGIPDCYLGFYDSIIAVDNLHNKSYEINLELSDNCRGGFGSTSLTIPRTIPSPSRENLLDGYVVPQNGSTIDHKPGQSVSIESNFIKEAYIAAINRAKEYIRQGDIYQVNLSQRFETELALTPFELYKRLRKINPAPFAAYLDFDEAKIISASPERFLKVDAKSRYIETRPIKGTRPRGAAPVEDERFKEQLLNSPKDRAEHIMIVDLERNDLGRVCVYGSVKPAEFIALEKYSTVFHLVSTVSGSLKKGVDAVDCLTHCFPGGSITGAPKIRAMEIIDELEPAKRSVYTGAIGYIGFNGNMDTSIAIRTFIVKDDKPSPCAQGLGKLYFQVGGGIVADSEPEAEYQETLDKAKALFEALGADVRICHCEESRILAGRRSNL